MPRHIEWGLGCCHGLSYFVALDRLSFVVNGWRLAVGGWRLAGGWELAVDADGSAG